MFGLHKTPVWWYDSGSIVEWILVDTWSDKFNVVLIGTSVGNAMCVYVI